MCTMEGMHCNDCCAHIVNSGSEECCFGSCCVDDSDEPPECIQDQIVAIEAANWTESDMMMFFCTPGALNVSMCSEADLMVIAQNTPSPSECANITGALSDEDSGSWAGGGNMCTPEMIGESCETGDGLIGICMAGNSNSGNMSSGDAVDCMTLASAEEAGCFAGSTGDAMCSMCTMEGMYCNDCCAHIVDSGSEECCFGSCCQN